MKTRKVLSFILMVALLVAMSITPGFATWPPKPPQPPQPPQPESHTLTTSKDGNGTVSPLGTFTYYKDVISCGQDGHKADEHTEECYEKVLNCNKHVHTEACNGEIIKCKHKCSIDKGCYIFECRHEHGIWCLFGLLCGHHTLEDCYRKNCKHECSFDTGCITIGRICGIKSNHTHNDNTCYKKELKCHTHTTDACFDWPEVTVTAKPDKGWYISRVIIDGVPQSVENQDEYSISLKMDDDHSVHVVFTEDEPGDEPTPPPVTTTTYYNLDVEVEGPGKVLPTSGLFTENSSVEFSINAEVGARFVGWFGENGSEVAGNSIVMNGNKKLIAKFEAIPEEEPEEELPEEIVPAASPEEDVVEEQDVPYDAPILPQTGGIPLGLMISAGTGLMTAGFSLRKKKKDDAE